MSDSEVLEAILEDEDFSTYLQLYRDDVEQLKLNSEDDLCTSMLQALDFGLIELENEHMRRQDAKIARQLQANESEDDSSGDEVVQDAHDMNGQVHVACDENTLEESVNDDLITSLPGEQQDGPDLPPPTDENACTVQINSCKHQDEGKCERWCVCCDHKQTCENSFMGDCGHTYCRRCLTTLVNDATKDETLLPVKCCKQSFDMTSEDFTCLLTPKLLHDYSDKLSEHQTADKTYCSNQVCSAFIKHVHPSATFGWCEACSTLTCAKCKQAYHNDMPCSSAEADDMLEELAKQEGWRRCESCKAVVELTHGCYHMTCRCSHEFCYLCGTQWKTCECEQWDEGRLVERAREIVERDGPAVEAQIQAVAANLLARHECNHTEMTYRHGGGNTCERCDWCANVFILECEQCGTLLCRRCRDNR